MAPLLQHILENFKTRLCYYKRGHFLKDTSSEFFIDSENDDNVNQYIYQSLNILISNINLLENKLVKFYT